MLRDELNRDAVAEVSDCFSGDDSQEAIARMFSAVPMAEAESAVQELRDALLALMEQEGVANALDLLPVSEITPAHRRLEAASDRVTGIFARCNVHVPDFVSGLLGAEAR